MCIELIFTKEEGNIIKIRMTLYLEEKSSTTPPPPKKKFSQLQILFLGGDGMWLRSTKGDQHCTEQFFILNLKLIFTFQKKVWGCGQAH